MFFSIFLKSAAMIYDSVHNARSSLVNGTSWRVTILCFIQL